MPRCPWSSFYRKARLVLETVEFLSAISLRNSLNIGWPGQNQELGHVSLPIMDRFTFVSPQSCHLVSGFSPIVVKELTTIWSLYNDDIFCSVQEVFVL